MVLSARPLAAPCSALQASYALTLELSPEDQNYDDKADILELNGLPESAEFLLRADSTPDERLLPVLRLLNLAGATLGGAEGGSALVGCSWRGLPVT